jgi:hypothetical protein
MSLRPEISGFSLETLFSLQGAKGREALPELEAKLRFRDPERTQEAHAILQRAIDESGTWADLEAETDMHVAVARVLAHHGQTHLGMNSNHWTMHAFWNFHKEHQANVPKEGGKYLWLFSRGRGIFKGGPIKSAWSFYGFLWHKEVKALRDALVKFRDADPRRADHRIGSEFNFLGELLDWLTAIEDAGKDLWFDCW